MPAIFFAIAAFIGWGFGDLLVAVRARRLDAYSGTFWRMVFTVVLFAVCIPFVYQDITKITFAILLFNIILGAIFIGGIIAFSEGLRIGNVALVSTIASSFTAITTILAVIFFNERLTLIQALIITAIFIGLVLTTLNIQELRKRKIVLGKGILFAILTMISFAVYFTFIKIPVKEIGWFLPNYITFLLFPLLYIFMRFRKIPVLAPTKNNALVPLIASTIIASTAEFCYNLGISRGYTSIVAPIAGASPVLTVLLAFLVFKDPITKQQVIGLVTTLLGIVLLSFVSA